ncbi:is1-family insertion element protein [Photorhabdus asymbiotica]|uniref:Is1-family insertion element protein n=1 Tax=Photorhabdus asymbiotica subsp. asymbiotica (strain ATCC 43949 / 3105-77) TaxID=553480 RepID=C7BMY2_PHOAA|nr:is1-family insertion element protein [Photorhabdus asymbiotica]
MPITINLIVFQLTYTYDARKPGVKEQLVEMAHNGAEVRDTARTLKLGITPSYGR